jgi:DNA uptake protein ComE-like DNA-binding protein
MKRIAMAIAVIAALFAPQNGHLASQVEAAGAGVPSAQARLNPNTATEAQLRAIPQLNPELAGLVLQNRPFAKITDLDRVIGARLTAEQKRNLYTALFVPINLNTAAREDIMLIPGMTARMAHEFEEYRPYTSLEQFNREIGKYVDAAEVARLRSYVTLN